jgi:hypothetical protein
MDSWRCSTDTIEFAGCFWVLSLLCLLSLPIRWLYLFYCLDDCALWRHIYLIPPYWWLAQRKFWLLKTMNKGTQGKRFSTMGRRTKGLGITKVGSASLFEKPQSGAREIPRLSDIIDDNDNCVYDANCDSSACNVMKNQCQLNGDANSAYCTNNACYKPKSTWQQQLCASYVIAAPSYAKSA